MLQGSCKDCLSCSNIRGRRNSLKLARHLCYSDVHKIIPLTTVDDAWNSIGAVVLSQSIDILRKTIRSINLVS